MNVAVIGAGYVGLTTGVALAYLGHRVVCVDADEGKVAHLRRGCVPFFEPGLDELLALAEHRLRFTTRYDEAVPAAEVVVVAVGTPPLPDGHPNLANLRAAAVAVGRHLGERFTVIVTKSTAPIGSGVRMREWITEGVESQGGIRAERRFAVVSCPEFLREGSALGDTLYPDRLVIGGDDPDALALVCELYRPIIEQSFEAPACLPRPVGLGRRPRHGPTPVSAGLFDHAANGARPWRNGAGASPLLLAAPDETPARDETPAAVPVVTTDLASAELTKYAANAFLALKVSFINEIGQLAEQVGADVTHVAAGIGLDRRIGDQFLNAGVGWGGSCLGKDTAALLAIGRDCGVPLHTVAAAREVNERQRALVIAKLSAELGGLSGRKVAIFGLAFKPQTDDVRDSPGLDIARRLIEQGATVSAHDPMAIDSARRHAPELGIQYHTRPEHAIRDADAVVLATEWPRYSELPWETLARQMRTPLVLDARNALDRARLERAGFRHLGMGR